MKNKPKKKDSDPGQFYGRMALRNRFDDIRNLVIRDNPTIIDGGANIGSTIDIFINSYKNPLIYAFEPIPKFIKAIEERYGNHKNIYIYPLALGSINKMVDFNMLNYPNSSSILEPGPWNFKYHGNKMQLSEKIVVEQIRLDDFLKVNEIDILKLDLQGYELEALKGCEKIISNIRIITTEVEFVPLYKNQALFSDIDIYLVLDRKLKNLWQLAIYSILWK